MVKEKYKDHLIIITEDAGKFAYSIEITGHVVDCTEYTFESSDLAITTAKDAIDAI